MVVGLFLDLHAQKQNSTVRPCLKVTETRTKDQRFIGGRIVKVNPNSLQVNDFCFCCPLTPTAVSVIEKDQTS